MARPLSQLVYSNIQRNDQEPRIITLHDHNQFGPDAAKWGQLAAPDGDIVALESYKGVFVAKDIVGYTWFLGPNHAPSPIFFGDSLGEIERFLWDYLDRSKTSPAARPWLVGRGQGGMMALAAALAVPDLLSGVVAIDAFLPIVGGWEPPLAPLDNLPVLLVNPQPSDQPKVLAESALHEQLTTWGANTKSITVAENGYHAMAEWIAEHPTRYLAEVDQGI